MQDKAAVLAAKQVSERVKSGSNVFRACVRSNLFGFGRQGGNTLYSSAPYNNMSGYYSGGNYRGKGIVSYYNSRGHSGPYSSTYLQGH